MIEKLCGVIARWCIRHGRYRVGWTPTDVPTATQHQYILFQRWGHTIALHRYEGTDVGEPHNHFFPNATLILVGGWKERFFDLRQRRGRFSRTRIRWAGAVICRKADDIHQLPYAFPALSW